MASTSRKLLPSGNASPPVPAGLENNNSRLWLCLHFAEASGRETLPALAVWALRFTPLVSLDPDGALLLEISASLGLFGGADMLHATVISGARQRGHVVMTGIAPTARAALWLARAGGESQVMEPARLPGVLARLPIGLTGWPPAVLQTLQRMGVRQLGDCMRLSRDGLVRRVGAEPLLEIDEALGRRPELRLGFRPDTRFRDELELSADTSQCAPILETLQVLLRRLEEHSRSRQAGVTILWVHLRHREPPATSLRIGLLQPRTDAAHLAGLVALHLSAVAVATPVTAVMLEADLAEAAPLVREDLLGQRFDQGERMGTLVERLRMRLGANAVHGIRIGREHRPERAWEAVPALMRIRRSRVHVTASSARRPLWILDCPAVLTTSCGTPYFHGRLILEGGPERVETGWWDGRDVRRDYYVARNPRGMRVWIFRDRRAGGWYLHGLFG